MRALLSLRGRVPAALLAAAGIAGAGAVAVFMVGSTHASASATCGFYWTGHTSTVWNLKTNWSLTNNGPAASNAPNSTAYVCMSTSPTVMPVITANATVAGIDFTNDGTPGGANGSLTINSGTFNSGTASLGASNIATLYLEGGALSGTTSVVNAALDSGTAAKPGTVTLTGTSTVGAITVSDHLINASTGTLTHSGDAGFITLSTATGVFENAGHFIETDGYYGFNWDSTAGSQVVNDGSGTYTLNVSPTDPNGTTNYVYPPFQNNGIVAAPSGILSLQAGDPGSTTDSGTWQGPNAGSGVQLAGGTRTEAASVSTTGPGAFDVTGATVVFTSGSSLSTLGLDGGTISGTTSIANATLNSGTVATPGTITLTGTSTVGAITVSDHLINASTGTLTHSGDTGYIYLSNGTGFFENAGHFIETDGSYDIYWDGTAGSQAVNDAGATFTVTISPSDPDGTTTYLYPPFQNNGTLTATSGTLVVYTLSNLSGGTLTGGAYAASGTGKLQIANSNTGDTGDVITNAAAISLATNGSILDGSAANALTGLATNSGTLTLGQNLTTTGNLANSGQVTLTGGKLQVTSSYTQTGSTSTTTVGSGATLKATSGVVITAGTLTGTGTVFGPVSGNGIIQPGTPSGTLTVTGTFAPGGGGTFDADFGSTGTTLLAASGAVTLSGSTLAITTDSGFTPTVGTVYTVLSGASRTGTFGAITGLPPASGGYGYQVAYTSTAVTVTVIPAVSIADTSVAQQTSSNATATFNVTLSAPFSQQVTVNYATADGSAAAGTDYTASSGTVTFPAGVTTEPVSVTVLPDAVCDPDEAFTVSLSSPVNSVVNRGTATGTITNTSPCMTVTSVTPSHVGQGASNFVATVNGSGFDPVATNDTVTFTGTGVTAAVSSATTTQLTIKLKVTAGAATTARDVMVSTSSANATCTGCLTVDAGPQVTSLSPNTLATGAASVTVTVTGSNFTAPVKVTFSAAKGSPAVKAKVKTVTLTSITLSVTVAQGTVTTPVLYTVKVTNADGGVVSKKNAFTVTTGPTFTSISPNTISRGTSNVPVTLTGTGFSMGMKVVGPKNVNITITSVSVDGTSASGTMTAASNAATGSNLPVTVVEPSTDGSGEATLDGLTIT